MRTVDPAAHALLDGSYRYWTTLTLDSPSVAGGPVTVDVTDGSYSEAADGIPQVRLSATLYTDDTPALTADLLQPSDVVAQVTAHLEHPTTLARYSVPLTPCWVQQITWEATTEGKAPTVDAVCLLGRLSANQMATPRQPGSTSTVTVVGDVLNNAGHHTPVTVNGSGGTAAVDGQVYDGDPAAAAAEVADQSGHMVMVTGPNQVTLVDTPGAPVSPFLIRSPVSYQVVQSRGPTKVTVQGVEDTQSASVAAPARYGTVTRTFTRADPSNAAGLLRRQAGLRSVLTGVELTPAPWLTLLDPVTVTGAPAGRIWRVDLPLAPGPMRLTLRTPED